jgi:hypothetical protein
MTLEEVVFQIEQLKEEAKKTTDMCQRFALEDQILDLEREYGLRTDTDNHEDCEFCSA